MTVAPERSWPSLIVVLVAVGAMGYVGSIDALLAAGILVVAWATLPAPFPFAVGQAAAVAVLTPMTPMTTPLFVVAEGALAGLLCTSLVGGGDTARTIATAIGTIAVLGTVAVVALRSTSVTGAALAVATIAGLCLYGLHRYEKVRLGLVSAESTSDETVSDT